jgi:hypothetical protein
VHFFYRSIDTKKIEQTRLEHVVPFCSSVIFVTCELELVVPQCGIWTCEAALPCWCYFSDPTFRNQNFGTYWQNWDFFSHLAGLLVPPCESKTYVLVFNLINQIKYIFLRQTSYILYSNKNSKSNIIRVCIFD